MSLNILYVAATYTEADILKKIKGIISDSTGYRLNNLKINTLVTGVGSISTAWAMKQWITENGRPDFALNSGIAGSYQDDILIGDVVMPICDCFADIGIEDGENFLTLFESGLSDSNEFPFKDGILLADGVFSEKMKNRIKGVRAITVNTSTGTELTRSKMLSKFNPDIETMEGATFFYICKRENIPFLALRAISNRVGYRNLKNWNIQLALDNLSEKINEILIILD